MRFVKCHSTKYQIEGSKNAIQHPGNTSAASRFTKGSCVCFHRHWVTSKRWKNLARCTKQLTPPQSSKTYRVLSHPPIFPSFIPLLQASLRANKVTDTFTCFCKTYNLKQLIYTNSLHEIYLN